MKKSIDNYEKKFYTIIVIINELSKEHSFCLID